MRLFTGDLSHGVVASCSAFVVYKKQRQLVGILSHMLIRVFSCEELPWSTRPEFLRIHRTQRRPSACFYISRHLPSSPMSYDVEDSEQPACKDVGVPVQDFSSAVLSWLPVQDFSNLCQGW